MFVPFRVIRTKEWLTHYGRALGFDQESPTPRKSFKGFYAPVFAVVFSYYLYLEAPSELLAAG